LMINRLQEKLKISCECCRNIIVGKYLLYKERIL